MVANIYDKYDDMELIGMIRESSEDAKDILFNKYRYIIEVEIKKYVNIAYHLGYEYVDLYQDGLVGFTEALRSYRDDKDVKLSTFITLCVNRHLQKGILKAGRTKNKIIYDSLSLEHHYDNYTAPLMDILSDNSKNDPLEKILKEENLKELTGKIEKNLSKSEFEVYNLLLNGLKYDEIAVLLNKNLKQVDNTIQRIKNKIKNIILNRK